MEYEKKQLTKNATAFGNSSFRQLIRKEFRKKIENITTHESEH
jgi:hypothetical protein